MLVCIAHRAEIEAGEAALEAMSTSTSTADARVAAAESRAREHEARAKALEKQLSDKDELIKYVEEEVERVKGEPNNTRDAVSMARRNRV